MSDGEPQFNKRPHGKVKFRPDCSQVLEEVHGIPGGAPQGDEGRVQAGTARQDLGYMLLLGSVGGVCWGTWAKARLVSSNPKELGFGKLCGRLLREVQRGKPWEVGENAYHQGRGCSPDRKLHALWLFGLLSRAQALNGGLVSV